MLSREFKSPHLSDPPPPLYLAPHRWHGPRRRTHDCPARFGEPLPHIGEASTRLRLRSRSPEDPRWELCRQEGRC